MIFTKEHFDHIDSEYTVGRIDQFCVILFKDKTITFDNTQLKLFIHKLITIQEGLEERRDTA